MQGKHSVDGSKTCFKSSCVIQGADLWKFYNRPLESNVKAGDVIYDSEEDAEYYNLSSDEEVAPKFISINTQTDFRESEAQTDPWDPPYIMHCKHKEPEILQFKNLSYGNGLPASVLEVQYILDARECCNVGTQLDAVETDEDYQKKRQLIRDQAKYEWKYKISKHNQEQIERLRLMETALAEELKRQTEKQDSLLKSIWTKKKAEVARKNSKLEKMLTKELHNLQPKSCPENTKTEMGKGLSHVDKGATKKYSAKKRNILSAEVESIVPNDKMDPEALASIKNWLEQKKCILRNEIPLAKPIQRSKNEKISEKAYEGLLMKKRTQLPQKIYHEDYDSEEATPPPVKTEVEFEILDLPDEGIDLATVWQQVLRGRAYQKQMLELIERHKEALEIRLSEQLSGKTTPGVKIEKKGE